MVATDFSSRVLSPNQVVRGSGVEDLALLELELGLVEDPGVTELGQLARLGQLRVRVGPGRRGRRLRRRLGVLRRWGLLRLLVGPPVALPPGDAVDTAVAVPATTAVRAIPRSRGMSTSLGSGIAAPAGAAGTGQTEVAGSREPGCAKAAPSSSRPKTVTCAPRINDSTKMVACGQAMATTPISTFTAPARTSQPQADVSWRATTARPTRAAPWMISDRPVIHARVTSVTPGHTAARTPPITRTAPRANEAPRRLSASHPTAISSRPPMKKARPSNRARVRAAATGLNNSTTPITKVATPSSPTATRVPVCRVGVAFAYELETLAVMPAPSVTDVWAQDSRRHPGPTSSPGDDPSTGRDGHGRAMRSRAAAVVTVFVVAGLSACSSSSDAETAAATSSSSSADVCAAADGLRGSLAALGDVQVVQQGTDAVQQAWTTVQKDWAKLADDARAQHADAVAGVQADADSVQAAIERAQAAPNRETLGTLASEVGTLLRESGALVDDVRATC